MMRNSSYLQPALGESLFWRPPTAPAHPIKILMTADTLGGVWTYALDLVRALNPAHYAVTLATLGRPLDVGQQQAVAQLPHLTVYESSYRLEWMDAPWEDVDTSGEWLLDLAATVQPDLVHLNGYAHAALPWTMPVIVVAHSCVLSWWRAVKGTEAPARYATYRRRVQAGLAAADVVVAPTHAMLATLTAIYGPVTAPRVIANGRATEAFTPAINKEPMIFSVGRFWDEAKNIAALEAVAAQIPWPIVLAGSTTHPAGHTVAVQHANTVGQLPPEDVADRMGKAAIYALPARYEPFGLSVLEAAAAGCALVLGDIATLRENWQNAALFVPPDDQKALCNALTLLINDPNLQQRLGERARKQAANFSLHRMGQAYAALYHELYPHRQQHKAANRLSITH